jgi:hypothetical protein
VGNETALLFWTAVAALGASLSAVVAAIYTIITYRLVRLQSDPHVIVYSKTDLDRPSFVVLVIENIGRDIAHDVVFIPDRPSPANAFGIEEKTAKFAEPMTDGPLAEGIPALGPGTQRVITWGQLGGISKALAGAPINLAYTYRSGKRRFSGSTQLDVRSYVGTDVSKKPLLRIAKSLEDLLPKVEQCANHLETIATKPEPRRSRWLSLRRKS